MAKIILGKRPTSFKKKVTFKLLDGSEGIIECDFKYRTRSEYGEFADRVTRELVERTTAQAKANEQAAVKKDLGLEFSLGVAVEKNADTLMGILNGWDLDESLTPESARQLADEVPGACAAIVEAYRAAVVDGHLGN